MVQLASKTEWVETSDGIRRLVVEGQPIPVGVGLEEYAQDENVDPRTLTRPVVDEEGAKSHYERTDAQPPDPNAGVSTENVEKIAAGSKRQARAQGGGKGSAES